MATRNTYYLDGDTLLDATAVYTDIQLTTKAPDGFYSSGTDVREQVSGLLLPPTTCPSCAAACGDTVPASFSSSGYFNADIELGGTPSDVGAVVIYFYVGSSIPDGALATLGTNTYNNLTFNNNSGTPIGRVNNSGTGLPTYFGASSSFPGSPYNNVIEYELEGGTYVNQGTTRTITVTANQNDTRGPNTFTMVIPKTDTVNNTLQLEMFAPLTGTFFLWDVSCPTALPSFSSTGPQLDISCNTPTQTYYFARNATRDSGSNSFTVDTNTRPIVGNYVFSDHDGAILLNDTPTTQYYIMDNNNYIQVEYGIVVATGACDPT